jgi:hypothetical protein
MTVDNDNLMCRQLQLIQVLTNQHSVSTCLPMVRGYWYQLYLSALLCTKVVSSPQKAFMGSLFSAEDDSLGDDLDSLGQASRFNQRQINLIANPSSSIRRHGKIVSKQVT